MFHLLCSCGGWDNWWVGQSMKSMEAMEKFVKQKVPVSYPVSYPVCQICTRPRTFSTGSKGVVLALKICAQIVFFTHFLRRVHFSRKIFTHFFCFHTYRRRSHLGPVMSPTQISVSSHRKLCGGERSHTYFCEHAHIFVNRRWCFRVQSWKFKSDWCEASHLDI
jgi:hypothetical protein